MSVFRNIDCLSLVVCCNTTLLKLQTVLFLLFSKFCASKSGVRLIYGCGLYTDVYGIQTDKGIFKNTTYRSSLHCSVDQVKELILVLPKKLGQGNSLHE